jgi:integrase
MSNRPSPEVRKIHTNAGKPRWRVELGTREGKRRSRTFDSVNEASAYLAEITVADRAYGNSFAHKSAREQRDISFIVGEMEQAGVTLNQVWNTYQKEFLVTGTTVGVAVDAFVEAQRKRGLRPLYFEKIERIMPGVFLGKENKAVNSLKKSDIERYLAGYPNPNTSKGLLGLISSFFAFCVREDWVVDNPALKITRPLTEHVAPKVLTVEEVTRLLHDAETHDPAILPYLLLGIFCGIRPQEIVRLEEEDFRWGDDTGRTAGLVTIRSEVSKTRRRRIVDIPVRLELWKSLNGAQWFDFSSISSLKRRLQALKARANVVWSPDIMRHTAASFMVARYESAEKAALQLGHSTETLMRHYRELVSPTDCARFYQIAPFQSLPLAITQ